MITVSSVLSISPELAIDRSPWVVTRYIRIFEKNTHTVTDFVICVCIFSFTRQLKTKPSSGQDLKDDHKESSENIADSIKEIIHMVFLLWWDRCHHCNIQIFSVAITFPGIFEDPSKPFRITA